MIKDLFEIAGIFILTCAFFAGSMIAIAFFCTVIWPFLLAKCL